MKKNAFSDYLLITETKLPSRIPGYINPTKKQPSVTWNWTISRQLILYYHVILFVYDIINTVSMDKQILLKYIV